MRCISMEMNLVFRNILHKKMEILASEEAGLRLMVQDMTHRPSEDADHRTTHPYHHSLYCRIAVTEAVAVTCLKVINFFASLSCDSRMLPRSVCTCTVDAFSGAVCCQSNSGLKCAWSCDGPKRM